MSSPLAIGAVSAVLRNLLDNGLIDLGGAMGGPITVTSVAPDTINLEDPNLTPRLNLFLYQVTPNSGWRNVGQPSRSAATGERLTNAPLALDLHYLVTAYGRADFQAEILLGYAMHLLHERPVLDRDAIRRTLTGGPIDATQLPPALGALITSDLADQAELIKITLATHSTEEMSKLWSAIQSKYRPSSAYQVSVVLIEGKRPAVSPLPVLTRGKRIAGTQRDEGVTVSPDLLPPLPTLFRAIPDKDQTGARLGETIVIEGTRLAGTGHEVRLSHRLLAAPAKVIAVAVSADGKRAEMTLPKGGSAQSDFVAGQLSATLHFIPPGETAPRETNAIPLVIAPDPVMVDDGPLLEAEAVRITNTLDPPKRVEVTLVSRPEVRIEQSATLMLDAFEANAKPRSSSAAPLVFIFPDSLPAATYLLRLRVDGTDSIFIDRKDPVPVFDSSQKITVP
jgi:Pvc16 N-terminal domain